MQNIRVIISVAISCLIAGLFPATSLAQDTASVDSENNPHAVILSYQRIGEDRHPDTSIREEQFRAQINELLSGPYNIMPVPDIISALEDGQTLPDRTVGITFDGAYQSAFEQAFPLLLENSIPFTVFVSPNTLGINRQYISESDLKRLARHKLVTVGLHPGQYIHLADKEAKEIRRQINNALTWYRDAFSRQPALFAYPFGEYSKPYKDMINQTGFTAAFGQQSGVAHAGSDMMALPRFVLTESHGDLTRFRLITNALPLPVNAVTPEISYIQSVKPVIGFSLDHDLYDDEKLSCFMSGYQDPVTLHKLGSGRIEIRVDTPLYDDRYRINCTLPKNTVIDGESLVRWRWFGMLLALDDMSDTGVQTFQETTE